MAIFKSFDESLFREFRSTTKEGLNDLAADQEEIDKIEFEVSASRDKVELRVDYSDFSKHVYFGSALAAVNFSLSRLMNDYPIDGELKDKNEWRRVNSGFENYFFDQYPKQQGHFYNEKGSATDSWIELADHEYKFAVGSSSVSFDAVVDFNRSAGAPGSDIYGLISLGNVGATRGYYAYFNGTDLIWSTVAEFTQSDLTLDYSPYLGAPHSLSFVYDHWADKQFIYVDGELAISKSAGGIPEFDLDNRKLYIGLILPPGSGYFFSGAIDDVRVWIGETRSPELIKKNYFRPVHANVSGGLKVYYKFNETSANGINVVDYSGNELHGVFTGSFSSITNTVSGTLGSFFKDPGDPIFDLANSRVSSFIADQRASGSYYDKENRNFIYKLIPSQFIDTDDHEDMQRFLLLMARHYDRLKIYIEHLSNIHNVDEGEFDNTPDELIGLVAEHYGLDLGNVYEGASALEYFFGEGVLPSGSMDTSIQSIRSQLRRNLLSNLIYIIKTKSTREALEASLRSLGLDESVVNINEYSAFSGGIETGRSSRTVERRVATFLTSSNVFLGEDAHIGVGTDSYQVRALFNTASLETTSSVFTFTSGAAQDPFFYLRVERNSLTSSAGVAKLYHSGSGYGVLSSSVFDMFDNKWINFYAEREITSVGAGDSATGNWKLFVSKLDCGTVLSSSMSASLDDLIWVVEDAPRSASLGTFESTNFDGHMQEFRAWSQTLDEDLIVNHTKDFESLAVADIVSDIGKLKVHLRLNDFTGSEAGTAPTHDYIQSATGSSYTGLSSSAVFNFPGKYIEKLEPSYSYDFGINNDKIRVRDTDEFTFNDIVTDVPYLSVDMSPVVSLNREIIRWFGDLEKFNNLIGKPFLRYREEIDTLTDARYQFFNERMDGKINFRAYLELLKWFDSNFTFFLNQLIPLDLGSSLSNFVVESHLLEHNQVPRVFPYKKGDTSLDIVGITSARPALEVGLAGVDIPLADPGRWGAAVSASAEVVTTENFALYFSSSVSGEGGVNFQRADDRQLFTEILQENSQSFVPSGYGNGWYTTIITGSNYLKNVLNVDSTFHISGVHDSHAGDSSNNSLYLSAAKGEALNSHFTGAINGVQDLTWLWYQKTDSSGFPSGPRHAYGIGYGGAWGQLPSFNNRGLRGTVRNLSTGDVLDGDPLEISFGGGIIEDYTEQSPIKIKEGTDKSPTFVLWPSMDSFEPVTVSCTGADNGTFGDLTGSLIYSDHSTLAKAANFWGEPVPIEGFQHLNVTIQGRRLYAATAAGANSPIKFVFKFQFFNQDSPGGGDFEGAFSSSFKSGSFDGDKHYTTERVHHEYQFQLSSSLAGSHNFTTHFERALPRAKFMRVFMRVEWPGAGVFASSTAYKLLVKGTLNEHGSDTQDKILNERKT